MKTAHINAGQYVTTGHTKAGVLVQYEITKNGSGWTADLIYGKGVQLNQLFSTKADAIKAVTDQG